MVGAGLSCALGLPNTAALVAEVLSAYETERTWRHGANLGEEMNEAFAFFYPDGKNKDFRPDAVDFFSTLKTYIETGGGFTGGLTDAPELYRKLKFAIARLLLERLRACDGRLKAGGHHYLDELVKPGNIVITSNWDVAIERYAWHKQIPVRFSGYDQSELVVLKLHGSLDWTLSRALPRPDEDYAQLNERITVGRPYKPKLPPKAERHQHVVRTRAFENWNGAWSFVSSRAHEPHMVTMARGKAGDLGPLDRVWRDAYAALTRARTLEIVGYSMPDDDVEIRTLLRAGLERGTQNAKILVRNPAPDVHDRVRRFLDHQAASNYQAVDSL
ncbi:MAG: hypothetical protein QOE69_1637 [Thermoleophilaceae bacterium]|jgi:hypothetical protein|nr:hypothetical protein [Thermoleophilaceae bacterium]